MEYDQVGPGWLRSQEEQYSAALTNAKKRLEELEDEYTSVESDEEAEKILKKIEYLEDRIDLYSVELTKARMWLGQYRP